MIISQPTGFACFIDEDASVGVAIEAHAKVGLLPRDLRLEHVEVGFHQGLGSWTKLPVISKSSGTISRFGTLPNTSGTILPAMPLLASIDDAQAASEVEELQHVLAVLFHRSVCSI